MPELKKTKGRNGDVWHIEYSYRCAKTDRMIRKRISKLFSSLTDEPAINAAAAPVIKEISAKLLRGWTPPDDYINSYTDVVEYHQTALMYGRKKKANRTVRYVVSKFIDSKISCKKSTIQNYTVKLRMFALWCDSKKLTETDISAITNALMLEFFDYLRTIKKSDPATQKHYRTMMWSFFNWAVIHKYLHENPVYDVKIPRKTTDYGAKPFLQHDATRLLHLIKKGDPQLYLACLFQYYLGIRPGTELRLLKIKDLDLYNNSITVNMDNAKNGKKKTIDVPKQLTNLCIEEYQLQLYPREHYVFSNIGMPGKKPLSKNNMRERFNRFRDALNLPDYYKYYSFKHYGAGRLLNSGASIEELMRHLRHQSIETTHEYIKEHFGERNQRIINHFPTPDETI